MKKLVACPFRLACCGLLVVFGISASAGSGAPLDCTKIYGSSSKGELFLVDPTTGIATGIGLMAAGLATEIEFDDVSGLLYAAEFGGGTGLHVIDPATGQTLDVLEHPAGNLTGLEFVESVLYGAFSPGSGPSPSQLVIVDLVTGELESVGLTGWGPISGMAYDPASDTLYGVTGAGPGYLVRIDRETGVATGYADTGLFRVGSIEFGPDGNLYGGRTDSPEDLSTSVFRIEVETGEVTDLGATGYSITGLATCTSVPEVDTDADGVLDPKDACPESIMNAKIVIGTCNTNVPDGVAPDGCTLFDQLASCDIAAGPSAYPCFRKLVYSIPRSELRVGAKLRIMRCVSKTLWPTSLSSRPQPVSLQR